MSRIGSARKRTTAARTGVLVRIGTLLAMIAGLMVGTAVGAEAATGLDVYVGYMDTHTAATSSQQPSPWPYTDPSQYVGTPCPNYGSTNACWDASAVRLHNNGSTDVTGVQVVVTMGKTVYDLWGARTVHAGNDLVLTETGNSPNSENFDGSDFAPNAYNGGLEASCTDSGARPIVTVTIGGSTTPLTDSGQVLNAGGVDGGHCENGTFVPGRMDESHPWVQIGNVPTDGSSSGGGGGSGGGSGPAPGPGPAPQPSATAPSVPTAVSATAADGEVRLTWSAPTSDGGSPVTGYRVYRGTAAGGETSLTEVGGTGFTDHGVRNGTTYFYAVAALNDVGASGRSEEVSATPESSVAPGPSPSPSPRVCAGLRGCHVMARADVNGDGHRDVVAMARRGGRSGARGALILRVEVGPGHIVAIRRRLDNWTGSPWLGVSRLDGHRGKDIVVGRLMGAAASFYQAVTWRRGRLVLLDAPGRGLWWSVEQSATLLAGWQRRAADPVGTIRRRIATHGPKAGPYQGTIKTYQWTRSGWRLVQTGRVASLPLRRALRWGGFDVPGLRQG